MASSVRIDGSLPDPGDTSTRGLIFSGGWGVDYEFAGAPLFRANQPHRLVCVRRRMYLKSRWIRQADVASGSDSRYSRIESVISRQRNGGQIICPRVPDRRRDDEVAQPRGVLKAPKHGDGIQHPWLFFIGFCNDSPTIQADSGHTTICIALIGIGANDGSCAGAMGYYVLRLQIRASVAISAASYTVASLPDNRQVAQYLMSEPHPRV
jgi:hypothetical protein